MKLKVFNLANSRTIKEGKPSFSINFKSGAITLNKGAVELTKLNVVDKICVAWDEEQSEWYLFKDDSGFPLRKANGNGDDKSIALTFNSLRTTDAIKEHLPVELVKPTGRMLLSKHAVNDNGKEYWPMLLPSFKPSNR